MSGMDDPLKPYRGCKTYITIQSVSRQSYICVRKLHLLRFLFLMVTLSAKARESVSLGHARSSSMLCFVFKSSWNAYKMMKEDKNTKKEKAHKLQK